MRAPVSVKKHIIYAVDSNNLHIITTKRLLTLFKINIIIAIIAVTTELM